MKVKDAWLWLLGGVALVLLLRQSSSAALADSADTANTGTTGNALLDAVQSMGSTLQNLTMPKGGSTGSGSGLGNLFGNSSGSSSSGSSSTTDPGNVFDGPDAEQDANAATINEQNNADNTGIALSSSSSSYDNSYLPDDPSDDDDSEDD